MPNYCNNCLCMDGNTKTIKSVIEFVKSGENVFDFEKIVPMPDNIYCGSVGDKEREIYGENNWYDWSIKNWGTKWNSIDAELDGYEIQFLTAWSPCVPVIATLAKLFPTLRFTYRYFECGMCFCGERIYENGVEIFKFDGDYAENYLCEEDDKETEKYLLSDSLFSIAENGIFTAVQDVGNLNGKIAGKLYYREYLNNKIKVITNGYFIADRNYSFEVTPIQLSSDYGVA